MEELKQTIEDRVKKVIIEKLGLDVPLGQINEDTLLFDVNAEGEGLDLDSVDALELVVGIKKEFGIKMQNADLTTLNNIKSIANMIRSYSGN